jgi:hypothetical protein
VTAGATPPAAQRTGRGCSASRVRTGPGRVPAATRRSRGRGGTVLFEVPFSSAMSDADLAVLARVLDVSTHMRQKLRPDPNSPGVARLDHFSGLFLERGDEHGRWLLQARTWGNPAPRSVHEWYVLAAQAARQFDARVKLPARLPDVQPATTDRPVGRAANKRLASIRRRPAGLA